MVSHHVFEQDSSIARVLCNMLLENWFGRLVSSVKPVKIAAIGPVLPLSTTTDRLLEN